MTAPFVHPSNSSGGNVEMGQADIADAGQMSALPGEFNRVATQYLAAYKPIPRLFDEAQ